MQLHDLLCNLHERYPHMSIHHLLFHLLYDLSSFLNALSIFFLFDTPCHSTHIFVPLYSSFAICVAILRQSLKCFGVNVMLPKFISALYLSGHYTIDRCFTIIIVEIHPM